MDFAEKLNMYTHKYEIYLLRALYHVQILFQNALSVLKIKEIDVTYNLLPDPVDRWHCQEKIIVFLKNVQSWHLYIVHKDIINILWYIFLTLDCAPQKTGR